MHVEKWEWLCNAVGKWRVTQCSWKMEGHAMQLENGGSCNAVGKWRVMQCSWKMEGGRGGVGGGIRLLPALLAPCARGSTYTVQSKREGAIG
jgi:hypothetical protein